MSDNGGKKPTHEWRVEVVLQEDLNLSHESAGGELLNKQVIEAGLQRALVSEPQYGVSVVKLEVKGPFLVKQKKQQAKSGLAEVIEGTRE